MCGIAVFLLLCACVDLRKRMIPLVIFMVAAIGSGIRLFVGAVDWRLALGGGMVGVACLCISKITREGFGYGDSLLILFLGIAIGIWKILGVLLLAFLGAAVYSAGLLTIKKKSRRYRYPFVPFLFLGYLGVILF